jgi:hypothetical protein
MDLETFDALARRLADGQTRSLRAAGSRRPVLVGLLAGAVGLLAWGGAEEAGAHNTLKKCKKIKEKAKKKACVKKAKQHNATHTTLIPPSPPPLPPCGGTCAGDTPQCCAATGFCASLDEACCSAAEGGGACPKETPKCCPPTEQFENGLCGNLDDTCCPSEKGGFLCPPGQDCCATSDDCSGGRVCSASGCCVTNTGLQSQATPADHDVRRIG